MACWQWRATYFPGKKSICDPAFQCDWADLQVAQEDNDVDLDVARQLFQPAPRGAPLGSLGRGDQRHAEVLPHRHCLLGAALGWKPPSERLADKIVWEYVNLGGSVCARVRKALEPNQEAPEGGSGLGGRNPVAVPVDDTLPVGVGCRLRDAIRDADKAENESDIVREEYDQRADGRGQQGDVTLPEDVSVFLGKHTHAAALNVASEACVGTRFDLVDGEAWGIISLRCAGKMADALRKGIFLGEPSVRSGSEEPDYHDEVPRR